MCGVVVGALHSNSVFKYKQSDGESALYSKECLEKFQKLFFSVLVKSQQIQTLPKNS